VYNSNSITFECSPIRKEMTYKNQAIGESILWWYRDEYWLHKSLQNIGVCLENGTSNIVAEKVIAVFLNRYSVRRTIKSKKGNDDLFLRELINSGFLNSVKNGEIGKLDYYARQFESSAKSSVKSALSKFAALCRPDHYIMYDTRSRRGMHRLKDEISSIVEERVTLKKIDNYSNYVKYAKILSERYEDEVLSDYISKLETSNVKDFLSQNLLSFKLRIVDKWLWLEGYHKVKATKFNTIDYIDLVNNER